MRNMYWISYVALDARGIMHQNTASLTVKPVVLQENAR